jgi:hypothetical protein
MNILTKSINKYGGVVTAKNRGTKVMNVGGDAARNGYVNEYVRLFDEIRDNKINFLEIGIFQGRSLAMWSDYFSNGKIYGIDIDTTEFKLVYPELLEMGAFENDNLQEVIQGDTTDSTILDVLNSEVGFSVIIDDGDHTHLGQLATFKNFFPLLEPGGFYIIEDIASPYSYSSRSWYSKGKSANLKSDLWDLNKLYNNIDSVTPLLTKINSATKGTGMIVVRKEENK